MPRINFTQALKRFYPDLEEVDISAENVAEVIQNLNQRYPGLKDYLLDEQGRLRQHVNIFIGNKLIKDKEKLSDKVSEKDEVFIMQALSGG
ncbi:MAG: molybdenum cofactor biosynthesis protein MoaD [Bacteroidetes bacterium]|nr:MAG: molybdenum cofactor biosynthesis protein MoaD [Bacteroidota bacterium]